MTKNHWKFHLSYAEKCNLSSCTNTVCLHQNPIYLFTSLMLFACKFHKFLVWCSKCISLIFLNCILNLLSINAVCNITAIKNFLKNADLVSEAHRSTTGSVTVGIWESVLIFPRFSPGTEVKFDSKPLFWWGVLTGVLVQHDDYLGHVIQLLDGAQILLSSLPLWIVLLRLIKKPNSIQIISQFSFAI